MKKLFTLLTLVILSIAMFTACSKDDENTGVVEEEENYVGDGSITAVTEYGFAYLHIYTFNEGDTVTIDWGDGKVETLTSVKETRYEKIIYNAQSFHEYSTKQQYTIKITSNMKIKSFVSDGDLISLDASECTSLEELTCDHIQLTTLDVSKNVNLEYLYCYGNQLTTLDVSKNVNLEYLYCSDYKLTTLDVSKCVKLESLDCSGCKLTTLDVSKCVKLESLYCYGCKLTTLDVSKCVNLEYLYCSGNQLTTLDVSKNVKLEYLYCSGNQFTASAMNQIYNALPKNGQPDKGSIYISQPYGDYSIAKEKGWYVFNNGTQL